MANVSLDSQILFTPLMMTGPKPTSRRPTNGHSKLSAIVISSDEEESEYEDIGYLSSTSEKPVPLLDELSHQPTKHRDAQSGSIASVENGRDAASSAGGDCGAVGPSASQDPESRDAIALGQEPQALGIKSSAALSPRPTRPGPLSVPPGPVQSDQDGAGHAINHNGPSTTEEASISEKAACEEAAAGLCRTSCTRDGARHFCSSARHFGPCSPRFKGDTSRQSTPRRSSADEGQNGIDGAGNGDASDTGPPRQCCETPPTDNGLDAAPHCDKELPSEQQKTGGLARSTPALSSRSSAPTNLRGEDQPITAGSASSEVRQASDPEDATCSNTAHEMPRTQLPRGRSHDGVEPPRTEPELGQKRASVRGRRRPRGTVNVDTNDEAEAEAAQQAGCQDMSRYPGRCRYNGPKAAEDEDMYCPEDSEGEQDEEDNDGDFRPPPRKRRKVGSTSLSTLRRTAAGRQVRPDGVISQPRQVRSSVPGHRSCGRLGTVRRSFSRHCGGGEGTVQAPVAGFQEWPLPDAILKRVIENGLATFQLQFTWRSSCADHQRKDSISESQQCEPPPKRRSYRASESPPPKQTEDSRAEFDEEEEWEVQEILCSRTHYGRLQYMVKWVSCGNDQEWYNAAGFKGSPHLLQKYHLDNPERPGPPVRLEQWLLAYGEGVEPPPHRDDNKPVKVH